MPMDRRVLAALLAVIVIGGAFYLSRSKGPRTFTGLEIAEMNVKFVESLKNPDGSYEGLAVCESSCQRIESRYLHGDADASYAYRALHAATGTVHYKERAYKAFERTLDNCKKENNCEVILPLIKDFYMESKDQELKSMIEERQAFLKELVETTEVVVVEGSDALQQEETPSSLQLFSPSGRLDAVKIFIAAYGITKDAWLLDMTSHLLDGLESAAKSSLGALVGKATDGSPLGGDQCFLQSARLVVYAETRDAKLLESTKEFFTRSDIEDKLDTMASLEQPLACADALLALSDLTGNEEYRASAEKILQHIVLNGWDSQYHVILDGKGGFMIHAFSRSKSLKTTAQMTGLLAKLADVAFEVRA